MEILENRIIHYEENIFYLKLQLNDIKKIENLTLNLELFRKKIEADMTFIFETSQKLYENLLQNDKLIIKNEQIHSILTLKCLYNQTCNVLINKGVLKESDITSYLDQNINDINVINSTYLDSEVNNEDITTNEELNILFMDEDSDEE